jgi:pimeloyl-ACP methyl ester carboxylesterase
MCGPFTAIGDGRAHRARRALEWAMLDRSLQHESRIQAGRALPLVMLPGTLCDARVFAPVLDVLKMRAHVPPLAGATTAGGLADGLLATLPGRFALCGFSLGAIVALEIAVRAPHRIDRIALIGCNPGTLSADATRSRAALSRTAFVTASYDHADPQMHALLDDMADATPPLAYQQQTLVTLTRPDNRPRLGRLRMPALIVCGIEDRICPPELSAEMARSIRRSRLALIEGAGHYVTLEQPEAVANEIAAWLAMPASTTH